MYNQSFFDHYNKHEYAIKTTKYNLHTALTKT